MKLRFVVAALPLALSACGGGAGGDGNAAAPAAPVAAAPAPAGQAWTDVVSATPAGGYVMGNPNAPIKLVEYGSRTCPVCGAFGREAMEPIKTQYVASGKVSYEFREFLVHGQPDFPGALLGRCGGPGPFFAILEQMYQAQEPIEQKMSSPEGQALFQKMQNAQPTDVAKAWADFLGYIDFVKQRGIPEDKARACLADKKEIDGIIARMNDAQQNKGVSGTPSFFVNDKKVDAITWGQLEPELKAAGA